MRIPRLRLTLIVFLIAATVYADAASFDLTGPKIEIKVTRAGKVLPIAQVPNLAPGDRLWVHPDFPPGQAEHYLLIVCFLRGSTNPPPDNWFTHAEMWDKHIATEGVTLTVPVDAQQALLFLAPSTGGDFSTLRNAVKGHPGVFVRAAQDLNIASYDRARYEKYVATIQQIPSSDTKALKEESDLLARSLSIKINQDCFQRPPGEQIVCLTSGENAVVMDDGHTSLVSQLTSGASADLLFEASSTAVMGGGLYSPYIGAMVDVVRLTSGLHTAQYQYIPALAVPDEDDLNLKLNNPPSFHNPKSVLVIGLPAVQPVQFPPLHSVDPKQVRCLLKTALVLPVEGAPLVFSSDFAHHLVLHIVAPQPLDLPLRPDAVHGGLVIDTQAATQATKQLSGTANLTGTVQGQWGFDVYNGPGFLLQSAPSSQWKIASTDKGELVVGRDASFALDSGGAACIDTIKVTTKDGKIIPATWTAGKTDNPNLLTVKLALKDVSPGPLILQINQFGQQQPAKVSLDAFADPPTPVKFSFHAGDISATLTGKGLEQIASVQVDGLTFTPGDVAASDDAVTVAEKGETLPLTLPTGTSTANLKTGSKQTAQIKLKDGRTLSLSFTVGQSRPRITLVGKNIQSQSTSDSAAVFFSSQDDMPLNGKLTFFAKSQAPISFPRSEKIEVATADGSLHTTLSLDNGSLVLENMQTVLATLIPIKAFGDSAFGELQFRAVDADRASDWQPLVKLVRVPSLKEVHCPLNAGAGCTLTGSNLYLIDSISSDAKFDVGSKAIAVPADFAGSSLTVPRPDGTLLYIKLRDESSAIETVTLPVLPEGQ